MQLAAHCVDGVVLQRGDTMTGRPGDRVIFFDLGQTLVTGATQSARRLMAARLGLSEKETRKVGRLIMTHPALEPSSLCKPSKEFSLISSGSPAGGRGEVWQQQRQVCERNRWRHLGLKGAEGKGLQTGVAFQYLAPPLLGLLRNAARAMAELVDYCVLSYRVGCKKPSPDLFRCALEQAETPAESCWMVGDSYELDIEPALAVGMHAIWVLAVRKGRNPFSPRC